MPKGIKEGPPRARHKKNLRRPSALRAAARMYSAS